MNTMNPNTTAVPPSHCSTDGTEASQSSIGTSTAVDYNLASIQKNSIIILDPIVQIQAVEGDCYRPSESWRTSSGSSSGHHPTIFVPVYSGSSTTIS